MSKPLLEVGWVLSGDFGAPDREAISRAHHQWLAHMSELFPSYSWESAVRECPGLARGASLVSLLDLGAMEKRLEGWDFAILITSTDLPGISKSFALGAPAQSLGVAVLSTARLESMSQRIVALVSHLFGHLNDLEHVEEPTCWMHSPRSPRDLDRVDTWSEVSLAGLRESFAEVADARLEELASFRSQRRGWRFVLAVLLHSAGPIWDATMHARPWLFPVLLSRLTTASVSTLLVLASTAEAWELGMSQAPWKVLLLSLLTILGTSGFVLRRQRLWIRRAPGGLTEQRVRTVVSISLAVLLGMTTTYVLLWLAMVVLDLVLFPHALVRSWAGSVPGAIQWTHHASMAGLVASIGLALGALGASFEAAEYFRHVTLVDEET